MPVSKEDREAYEEGQKDRGNPVSQFIEGLMGEKSDTELAAYQKGVEDKQLDGDKK